MKFNLMYKDVKICEVLVNLESKVAVFGKVLADVQLPLMLYGGSGFESHEPDFGWLEKFMIARTFPRNRINCEDILVGLGLERYDIWEIAKKTNARSTDDPHWCEFIKE